MLWTQPSKRKRTHKRVSCLPFHSTIAVWISQETRGQTAADSFREVKPWNESPLWNCTIGLVKWTHLFSFYECFVTDSRGLPTDRQLTRDISATMYRRNCFPVSSPCNSTNNTEIMKFSSWIYIECVIFTLYLGIWAFSNKLDLR